MQEDVKKTQKNNLNEIKTTGHEWDGIKENDLPDPLWLRYMFYIALFFSLGYWLLYPSWPSQHADGALDWSSEKELKQSLDEIESVRNVYLSEFNKTEFHDVLKTPELLKFALAGGKAAFANNCAVCHGAGGNGNTGYPNLTAGAWIWGGKIEDIYQTLKYGIRSGHEESRDSQMAAFGKDGLLTKEEVNVLTEYVISLHQKGAVNQKGDQLFQQHCASCHGKSGEGGREFGAPTLNDAVWLYGDSKEAIYDVIYNGRQGVMPYWSGKLDDPTIKQLAIYVHQLGGGE